MTATTRTNPFPIEAVATFGEITKNRDDLNYMRAANSELSNYLKKYLEPDGYGAAIPLQGGHGSGKTHLLTWLARKAEGLSSIQPIVLYAKADEANFYNIYSQLMDPLKREILQGLLSQAMVHIAREQVQQAKATESIENRINSPEDLPQLYEEKNLARDQLLLTLQQKLEETKVPIEIPRTLMQIDSATYGDVAYEWLIGNRVAPVTELGLSHNLLDLTARGTALPDLTAVNALETVAVVLSLAERPLIVLIDQMEVLFRVKDYERRETLFSVIKKLMEHLKRQKVLMFLAGTDEVWEEFSRDSSHRLRSRDPIQVGGLSIPETTNLLDAYIEEQGGERFSDAGSGMIKQLSGGNPREILRIAHHAFKAVAGRLDQLNDVILLKSAEQSGTVADQQQLAFSIAEKVLAEFGTSWKNLEATNGQTIDFLLMVKDVPRLALITAKATDKLSEVTSAKRIQEIRGYAQNKWPGVQVIVVSVGYSSKEVEELLSVTSIVMEFDERQFANQLRSKVAGVLTEAPPTRAEDAPVAADKIGQALDKIADRLDRLETKRAEEASRVSDRFSNKVEELARPETEQREFRTRFEMLEELDMLQETLLRAWESWLPEHNYERWKEERRRIMSILISNETNLKIKNFERVGALYQELLAEESGFRKDLDKFNAELNWRPDWSFPNFAGMPRDKKMKDPRWILSEVLQVRLDLIKIMRRLLQEPHLLDKWLEQPLLYAFVPTATITGIIVLIVWWSLQQGPDSAVEKLGIWAVFFLKVFPFTLTSFGISVLLLFVFRWARVRRWDKDVEWVKGLIRRYQSTEPEVSASN
jgi:hypothetical protein